MAAVSKAESTWQGGLADGHGRIHVASGAFDDFEVTWAARAAMSLDVPFTLILVPAIHVFLFVFASKTWMPGTRPGMTMALA